MINRINFNELMNFNDLVKSTVALIDETKNKTNIDAFKPTYFEELDGIIEGLEIGKITAVVGRPSMGKTLFTMNIIKRIVSDGTPVLVFSLSLCKEEWTKCLLCSEAELDLHKVRIGMLNDNESVKLNEVAQKFASMPLFVRDQDRRLKDIVKVITQSVKEHHIGLVLVDGMSDIYGNTLQSIKGRGFRYDKQLIALKEVASNLHIPIMVTQNLSRRIERNPHSYIPKHEFGITEGNLALHASRILHLYREEYYRPKKRNRGVMNIRIPAMKYGDCHCNVMMHFDRSTGVVKEYERTPFDPDRK